MSLDGFLRQLTADLYEVVMGGREIPLKFYIPNTDNSSERGLHWMTVAVSMRRAQAESIQARLVPSRWQEEVSLLPHPLPSVFQTTLSTRQPMHT